MPKQINLSQNPTPKKDPTVRLGQLVAGAVVGVVAALVTIIVLLLLVGIIKMLAESIGII